MLRPSPVPCLLRSLVSWPFPNLEKSFLRSRFEMPEPVSVTWNFKYFSSMMLLETVMIPFEVNFKLFDRRLIKIYFNLHLSVQI